MGICDKLRQSLKRSKASQSPCVWASADLAGKSWCSQQRSMEKHIHVTKQLTQGLVLTGTFLAIYAHDWASTDTVILVKAGFPNICEESCIIPVHTYVYRSKLPLRTARLEVFLKIDVEIRGEKRRKLNALLILLPFVIIGFLFLFLFWGVTAADKYFMFRKRGPLKWFTGIWTALVTPDKAI